MKLFAFVLMTAFSAGGQQYVPSEACTSLNRGEVINDYRCTEIPTGFVWIKRQPLHCAQLEHEVHLPLLAGARRTPSPPRLFRLRPADSE